MRSETAHSRARLQYWLVPVARAIVNLAFGMVITFSADHTARTGLVLFGVYAVLSGLVLGVLSALSVEDRSTLVLFLASGGVGVVVGVAALALSGAGLALFLYLVGAWALVTGLLELVAALRRRGDASSRDWTAVGVLTLALALVMLLIPADPVLAVGLFGAYAMILGVYLAIAGLSLRWARAAGREVSGG